jgi:hypothetical protein
MPSKKGWGELDIESNKSVEATNDSPRTVDFVLSPFAGGASMQSSGKTAQATTQNVYHVRPINAASVSHRTFGQSESAGQTWISRGMEDILLPRNSRIERVCEERDRKRNKQGTWGNEEVVGDHAEAEPDEICS